MNSEDAVIVRVYLQEAKGQLSKILEYLHDESKVRGVTVFRGICGFGSSGKLHSSSLLDMSLDLPIVVEFYDRPDKVDGIIAHLNETIKPGHIVYWSARVNA